MTRKVTYVLLAFSLVIGTGCMVGKKYSRPTIPAGIEYPNATKTDTSALATWFNVYHDTALQSLIKMAIDSNLNLRTAGARMQEALALSGAVKANLYPFPSYQGAAGGGKSRHRSYQSKRRCGRWPA